MEDGTREEEAGEKAVVVRPVTTKGYRIGHELSSILLPKFGTLRGWTGSSTIRRLPIRWCEISARRSAFAPC